MHLGRAANEEWGTRGEVEGVHCKVGRSGVGGGGKAHKYCSFTWDFGAWRNLLTAQEAWKVEWWKQTNILSTWQHASRLGRYLQKSQGVLWLLSLSQLPCPQHGLALSDLFGGLSWPRGQKGETQKWVNLLQHRTLLAAPKSVTGFLPGSSIQSWNGFTTHTQNRSSFL